MSIFSRRRVKAVAAGALAALAVGSSLALAPAAQADTGPGYATIQASVGTQTNIAPNGTALRGLVDGQPISILVTSTAPNTVPRVEARQCRDASAIGSFNNFRPSTGGRCASDDPSANQFKLSGGADSLGVEYNDVLADNFPTNTHVAFSFLASTGTALNAQVGQPDIVCSSSSSCELWLRTQQPEGTPTETYDHFDLLFAGTPGAPTITSVTPSSTRASVVFTAPANDGNADLTDYTVVATPTSGPGSPVTLHGATSPVVFPAASLNSFTTYDFTVAATNTAADGTTHFTGAASSAVSGIPAPAGPTALTGSPANAAVALSWVAAADTPSAGYQAVYCARSVPATPCTPSLTAAAGSGTSFTLGGLANGTVYDIQVRGDHGGGNFSVPSNTITAAPVSALVTQTITVRRPQGALVLTQVCGVSGSPDTNLAADTAPIYAGGADPLFSQYPYPVDGNGDAIANYPTDCGVQLGNASLITSGPGAGQYFRATGNLHQITVVDTRDTDAGWAVTGTMGSFTSGVNSFSGSHLGWVPAKTSDTAAYDSDLDGTNDYDQAVTAGALVNPSTVNGLGNGETWATAPAGSGLGIAVLDAGITLNIPVVNNTGTYTGVLTITAA